VARQARTAVATAAMAVTVKVVVAMEVFNVWK
jgi:hypothetical protein